MTHTEKQIFWQLKNASKTGKTQNNVTPTKRTSTGSSRMSAVSLLSVAVNEKAAVTDRQELICVAQRE